MKRFWTNFKIDHEKESQSKVIDTIVGNVTFRGTNLWVLIFAVFIASLGLNINSPSVIIGAMLISPIMGPILGLGLGLGINDLGLVKKALSNYFLAAGVGLVASTIFFLISPLREAHSEILARTSPDIYDVLIAFLSGLAGIIATSSKFKGNVIPGVAIATALIPPLCTAGYGLATLQFTYFSGALYLFVINTVFIALATLFVVRLLKFPEHHVEDPKDEATAKRMIWIIVILTLLPSIYFGYDIVQQSRFTKKANRFIELESNIPNDYLLKSGIDAKKKTITLVYGGELIDSMKIKELNAEMKNYDLNNARLEILQGFSYYNEDNNEQQNNWNALLAEKEMALQQAMRVVDSVAAKEEFGKEILMEASALYPDLKGLSISQIQSVKDNPNRDSLYMVYARFDRPPSAREQKQFDEWMEAKLRMPVRLIIED